MSPLINDLLTVRLLVAALGERVDDVWWRSQFLTTTGVSIGSRIFPRRTHVAALTSTTVAARRDHDEKTGMRSFHLFRLPSAFESQLVDAANSVSEWAIPEDVSEIVAALDELSGAVKTKFSAGPKSLGKIQELKKASSIRILASLYAESVRKSQRVYPYFEAAEDE